jgi:hypothetical protein
MSHPLGQDSAEMPLVERNHIVETLTTYCPDQAFAIGVRLRHLMVRPVVCVLGLD